MMRNKIGKVNWIEHFNFIDLILIFDIFLIILLFFNVFKSFNLLFIFLDFLFSLILFKDIFNNIGEDKFGGFLSNLIVCFTTVPYDLLGLFIPFFSNMSVLKVLRLLRITLKLVDLFKSNKKSKIQKVMDKTNTVIVFNVLFTLIFCSIILLSFYEHMSAYESIYFVIVTFSSVGYGDVVARTIVGKSVSILVSVLGIFGVGFLSTFCLTYVNFDEEKEKELNELIELKEQNKIIIDLLRKRL